MYLTANLTTKPQLNLEKLAIFTIYLFNISAIIGILIGHKEWFVTKTPLNLVINISFLILLFPQKTLRFFWVICSVFSIGFIVEYLGVQYGWVFGAYIYGNNLGWTLSGVPVIIGFNWVMLSLVTYHIASHLQMNRMAKIFFGSLLMVFIDILIEPIAPIFDFWRFEGGYAPFSNYLGWFLVSIVIHTFLNFLKLPTKSKINTHIYVSQILFFGVFNIYYLL